MRSTLHFYAYIPLLKQHSPEEFAQFVSELAGFELKQTDTASPRPYCNWVVRIDGLKRHTNTLAPLRFASDPREFVRFRVGRSASKLIENLKMAAIKHNGYYGKTSKVFQNAKGEVVYNVYDGETYVNLSRGEVVDELVDSGAVQSEEQLLQLNQADLANAYQEKFEISLKLLELNHFGLPIALQNTKQLIQE